MPIVKILARGTPSYGSLVNYLLKEGKGKDGRQPHILTHNFRGATPDEWIREFKENEAWRKHMRQNQTYLYHEIVSFSNKENPDTITREMLEDIAQKYMEFRGNDGMYLAAFHEDKDHAHIHFAVSGVKYKTGMAHRLSKDGMRSLKDNIQIYQQKRFPELSFSLPNHGAGKGYKNDKEYFLEKRKNDRSNAKEMLREQVATLHAQATNQQEFLELLRDAGLHHYERNGVPTGIVHEDIRFRFSHMDIPMDTLAIDLTQEQIALQQIQDIRRRRYEMDRDEMDMTRYIHLNPNSLFE
jgi:hypothetical protein